MNRDVKTQAAQLLVANPVEKQSFLVCLSENRLDEQKLIDVALEIGAVVAAFPRFLAALIAQLPDWRLRMELVENLFEEHGRMDPRRVHEQTYWQFAEQLGATKEQIQNYQPKMAATLYIRAMLDLCGRQSVAEAIAALGMVEEIVARASLLVTRFNQLRAAENESHFSVHEVLDLEHADELYALAQHYYDKGEKDAVTRGLRLGQYYHFELYRNLMLGQCS